MTSIIVAFSKIEDATAIKNLLVRNGYPVVAACTSGTKVLSILDDYNNGIVVCGHKINDMMYYQIRENLSEEFEMLLLSSPSKADDEYEGVVNVSMPLKTYDFINTVDMLVNNIAMRKKKRRSMPSLRSKEEKIIIEKAKEILMNRNNMTEVEAHKYIQKTSMDSGTNMIETAEMIIRIMLV